MKTNCAIYQFIHIPTGMRYIGASKNLSSRKSAHYSRNFCSSDRMYDLGFANEPIKNFHFGVIEYFDPEITNVDLAKKEMSWIGTALNCGNLINVVKKSYKEKK